MRLRLRLLAAVMAAISIAAGVFHLEAERRGLILTSLTVGTTPVTVYRKSGAEPAPAVVIAHGFAGSRQLMEAYALTLARSGYVVASFDFEGHGRNPEPMSGDVTRIDGTTQLLMQETGRVIDAAVALPGTDGRVALLGHSMASDIVVRQAIADRRVAATVAVSMFSQAVTAEQPVNLLVITGAWEQFLRAEAARVVRLADPDAVEGQTVGQPALGTGRRAVAAPSVEHVGVLYSATALREARDWLDTVFGRASNTAVSATGGWIVLVLAGIVLLAYPLSALLPAGREPPARPRLPYFLAAAFAPALVAPLALSLIDTRFLPVLVADYLAAHMFVYGVLALAILAWGGVRIGRIAWFSAMLLAAYGVIVFGMALDRYAASFVPHPGRIAVILAIMAGAVPYMLADSVLSQGGLAPWWRVLAARTAFLASLALAVALDFERLFFLLIILPVIVVFFIIFGLMGGWVGRRTKSPFASGVGLGIILAWALGVSFPLFEAG